MLYTVLFGKMSSQANTIHPAAFVATVVNQRVHLKALQNGHQVADVVDVGVSDDNAVDSPMQVSSTVKKVSKVTYEMVLVGGVSSKFATSIDKDGPLLEL